VTLPADIEAAISEAEQSAVQELNAAEDDAEDAAKVSEVFSQAPHEDEVQVASLHDDFLPRKKKIAAASSGGRCRKMVGEASWYGPGFQGHTTASGERFNTGALTAAHRTLPFGVHVRVTNLTTGRHVIVKINDRGPFVRGRVIDLSHAAARQIGMDGTTRVSLEACL
jgi:rare lipoprotein A